MMKAVIFDVGGVILDMRRFSSRLVHILEPRSKDQFWQELNLESLPLSKGQLTIREFCERFAKKYNKKERATDLLKVWVDEFEYLVTVNQEVLILVNSLRKHYKVAVITNTNVIHSKICQRLG